MASNLEIILLSLQAATVATLMMSPAALFVSLFLVRSRSRWKFLVDLFVSMPLALPPVVIGFALLWLFGGSGPFGDSVRGVAFSWFAMSLAAAVVSFPLVVRSFVAGLSQVDRRLELAAKNLGAGSVRVAFTVTLPLARRGIGAGLLLGFVRAIAEFGATVVFAGNIPGRTQGIPSAIFSRISSGDFDAAWVLAAVSIVIGGVALVLHNMLLSGGGIKRDSR